MLSVLAMVAGLAFAPACPDADAEKDDRAYGAIVLRVIDGDTLLIKVATTRIVGGLGVEHVTFKEERLRVRGIDAAKKGTLEGNAATLRLTELVGDKVVRILTQKKDRRDRWQRLLGYVCVGGIDVGALMLEEGVVEPWGG